jgi:peroxiredoxin
MIRILYVVIFFMTPMMACSSKREENAKPAASAVNEYPNLILKLADGSVISTRDLKGKNVFILFQPDCDHCQAEAADIEERLNEFKDYTLYFISSSPMDKIKMFAEDYHLDQKKNVIFAWTSTDGVLNHYGPIPTPSVYIYADGKLKKSFNGQTGVENILNSL